MPADGVVGQHRPPPQHRPATVPDATADQPADHADQPARRLAAGSVASTPSTPTRSTGGGVVRVTLALNQVGDRLDPPLSSTRCTTGGWRGRACRFVSPSGNEFEVVESGSDSSVLLQTGYASEECMTHDSPLRYPGGKARLADLLSDIITLNGLESCDYFEPFAGGAGAALKLLDSGTVSHVHLNDADRRVYAFWRSCTSQSELFAERILKSPVTIDEWRRQRSICSSPRKHNLFDLGFAAFFLNRCNRSGVLDGAGPIGGYGQTGKWRLDVRFNRQELASRVLQLGRVRSKISLSNLDALVFLKQRLPRGSDRKNTLVYLDPPYVQKGQRLYLNAYSRQDHRALTIYLRAQRLLNWFASYDDASLIRQLYANMQVCPLPIHYSLQVKRMAIELAIAPQHVLLPAHCRNQLLSLSSLQRAS